MARPKTNRTLPKLQSPCSQLQILESKEKYFFFDHCGGTEERIPSFTVRGAQILTNLSSFPMPISVLIEA